MFAIKTIESGLEVYSEGYGHFPSEFLCDSEYFSWGLFHDAVTVQDI
jgi:hypothetical protein